MCAFVSDKVTTWTSGVGALAEAAITCKKWYQTVNPALKSCAMH